MNSGKHFRLLAIGASTVFASAAGHTVLAQQSSATHSAAARAAAIVENMSPAEKTVLTHGIMPLPLGPNPPPVPAEAIPGAGYVPGIARLGVPALRETDASLGIAYVFGLRKDGATALPSGLAMAATWNPNLTFDGGRMIGSEARAKGFNVLLAGGVNLVRDPRCGRNFEYLGEDPLLAGTLVGASIKGIQSNHIIATIKHFALNGQETGRKFADVQIGEAAARESDLLAFQIGIEIGRPGAVMCAYNRVLSQQACDSDWLLNRVLKRDWGYRGFVMSDWGAVPALNAALHGLDQQSAAELDAQVYFDVPLSEAAKGDPTYAVRLDDMNRRILTAIFANELDVYPAAAGGTIDTRANAEVAERVARQAIVLLRNERGLLPLTKTTRRIAVIGGFADSGVMSGGGSSQVQGQGGPAISLPLTASGQFAPFLAQSYHRSSPLAAIRAMAPQAELRYRDGRYVSEAVAQARQADVAIVFATQWTSEGFDQPDLSLPDGQDALIAAVTEANSNTIVVLETGGPVAMPWLSKTAAVLEAWYPGARGGEAIASVLFGETNPSGRLPVTFPASESQLPRRKVDGFDSLEPDFQGGASAANTHLAVNYNIEGSDVGYRWFARQGEKPLFPFGYGLSYTTFTYSAVSVSAHRATLAVTNTGKQAGDDVVQIYLVSRTGRRKQRLVGFQRISLEPGTTRKVTVDIDARLLADWSGGRWAMPAGDYEFAPGKDAADLGPVVTVKMPAKHWKY